MKTLSRLFIFIACAVTMFGIVNHTVFAAGNIDSTNKYSQFLNIDLDNNSVHDFVNWNPTNGGATVSDTSITGTIWGETVGWINLAPANGGVTVTCGANPTTDPAFLSGYGWGQNTGWVNFSPTAAVGVNKPQIDPATGALSGYVWSQNYGYLNLFSAASGHPGVITSWHGCGTTPPPPPPPPGGCTSNCITGGGPILTVTTTVTNSNGGTSTLGSFQISVKDHGSDIPGSPYTPNPTAESFNVLTGDSYHVQVNNPAAYTVIYGGSCSNQGDVTISASTQNCTVGLYDGHAHQVDYCPNIAGNQLSIPSGDTVDSDGNCVPVITHSSTTDVCPNIAGDQVSIPTGMMIDVSGNCVTPQDNQDFCPNISGIQTSIPSGMTYDSNGNCVPVITHSSTTDLCPNIVGDQAVVPHGYTVDHLGNCIPQNQFQGDSSGPTSLVGIIESTHLFNSKTPGIGMIVPILSVIGLLSTIPGLITRFANMLLAFLLGRKRQRGVVYDSENKEPLDPAYISVIDMATGKEVVSQITDIHGRYGFILEPGTYKLTAGKTHYSFPSLKLAGKTSDEAYSNLYFGEPFTVVDKNQVVTMNIPMDRVGTDWNQVEKERMNIVDVFSNMPGWLTTIFDVLFVLGFVVSLITTYYNPNAWNIIIIILYVIIGVAQFVGYGPIHAGVIKKNGQPLSFAIVRAFNVNLQREIAHTVTSSAGGYYILVPKATYYITVETKNPDGTYSLVYTSQTMNASQGLISKKLDI